MIPVSKLFWFAWHADRGNGTGYPNADFFKKHVPSATAVIIPSRTGKPAPQFPSAYARVKNFLKTLLRNEIEYRETHPDHPWPPPLISLQPADIVDELRIQLEAYWRGEWPFTSIEDSNTVEVHPLEWWQERSDWHGARVLAVCTILIQVFFDTQNLN